MCKDYDSHKSEMWQAPLGQSSYKRVGSILTRPMAEEFFFVDRYIIGCWQIPRSLSLSLSLCLCVSRACVCARALFNTQLKSMYIGLLSYNKSWFMVTGKSGKNSLKNWCVVASISIGAHNVLDSGVARTDRFSRFFLVEVVDCIHAAVRRISTQSSPSNFIQIYQLFDGCLAYGPLWTGITVV